MTNSTIRFESEINGYDRNQVDKYIARLGEMYQANFDEYRALNIKYEELLETNKNSNVQKQTELNPDVVAKALINAEAIAQKIIDDAQYEAAEVIANAQKTIDDAIAKAARAEETAQEITNKANDRAKLITAQARKSLIQTQKTIEQTSEEIKRLLTFRTPETEKSA